MAQHVWSWCKSNFPPPPSFPYALRPIIFHFCLTPPPQIRHHMCITPNGSICEKPTHTDQYLHCSSHHQTSCKESAVSSLFNGTYSIITNNDDLTKESARIKQVLKENGYQESFISKIFKKITNNHSLSQSQLQTQATDIQERERERSE